LIDRVCSVLGIEPKAVGVPSKTKAPAEARGIISYIAVRELGYKGKDVGRELHLGPTGVSIAVRRGEKIILHALGIKSKVLASKIDK